MGRHCPYPANTGNLVRRCTLNPKNYLDEAELELIADQTIEFLIEQSVNNGIVIGGEILILRNRVLEELRRSVINQQEG